jgi:hypothetical protein
VGRADGRKARGGVRNFVFYLWERWAKRSGMPCPTGRTVTSKHFLYQGRLLSSCCGIEMRSCCAVHVFLNANLHCNSYVHVFYRINIKTSSVHCLPPLFLHVLFYIFIKVSTFKGLIVWQNIYKKIKTLSLLACAKNFGFLICHSIVDWLDTINLSVAHNRLVWFVHCRLILWRGMWLIFVLPL